MTSRSWVAALLVVCSVALVVEAAPAAGQVSGAECAGEEATIVGTDGDDVIEGTAERDVIDAGGGNDTVTGLGGNDDICGGDGDDVINGGDGGDFLRGGPGNDEIRGGGGNDFLQGDANEQTGDGGNDELYGEEGGDQLGGGPGINLIDGGADGTPTAAGVGDTDFAVYLNATTPVTADLAEGRASGDWGIDQLVGIENVSGGTANDVLRGDARSNGLVGNGGDDTLSGRDATDYLDGDGLVVPLGQFGHLPGNDDLRGGDGIDIASYRGSAGALFVDLAAGQAEEGDRLDTLAGIESIEGSDFDDFLGGDAADNFLFGGPGADGIAGNEGADSITGGPGDDVMLGGDGDSDIVYFTDATEPVTVDMAATTATGAGEDRLADFEAVVGSPQGDTILGDAGVNYLFAGVGSDTIDGRGGLDLVSYHDAPGGVAGSFESGTFTMTPPGGSAETDTLLNIEGIEGSDFDDRLDGSGRSEFFGGGGGSDILTGDGGHDWFTGDSVNDPLVGARNPDVINGGDAAFDLISYALADAPVRVDLRAGEATGEGSDALTGVEAIRGSAFADALKGDGQANRIYGLKGRDQLFGRAGRDQLVGGQSRDILRGGRARDLCVGGPDVAGCEEVARPRSHPLFSTFAEWERFRFRRRLRVLARLSR